MDPDRTDTDMREDSHKWPAPLEDAGERGGFAINPQTLIFFVFPTANCCGCCSGITAFSTPNLSTSQNCSPPPATAAAAALPATTDTFLPSERAFADATLDADWVES